jgi:DNA (cytosine-5)-methyltransferase 1
VTRVYYNENDKFCVAWLHNLIDAGLIPPGDVDDRSIADVRPKDLEGYTQAHWFCGLGGWAYAARLAGWPDDKELWTGSCPCQPFSVAGSQKGFTDERHLWPVWKRLIAKRRPRWVVGEQVASAAPWLRLVRSDLERMGYAVGCLPVEAASAGACHKRDRYWFVAHADQPGAGAGRLQRGGQQRGAGGAPQARALEHAPVERRRQGELRGGRPAAAGAGVLGDADQPGSQGRGVHSERVGQRAAGPPGLGWIVCADGKARRVPEPGVRLLVNGSAGRVAVRRAGEEHWYNRIGALKALGNAIYPPLGAEILKAVMEET